MEKNRFARIIFLSSLFFSISENTEKKLNSAGIFFFFTNIDPIGLQQWDHRIVELSLAKHGVILTVITHMICGKFASHRCILCLVHGEIKIPLKGKNNAFSPF